MPLTVKFSHKDRYAFFSATVRAAYFTDLIFRDVITLVMPCEY